MPFNSNQQQAGRFAHPACQGTSPLVLICTPWAINYGDRLLPARFAASTVLTEACILKLLPVNFGQVKAGWGLSFPDSGTALVARGKAGRKSTTTPRPIEHQPGSDSRRALRQQAATAHR